MTTRLANGWTGAVGRTPSSATGAQRPGQDVSRREFLYYIWGASMALLLAETGGAIVWFALPKFRAGEFGGIFSLEPASLPAQGSAPVQFSAGKFWISNTNDGLLALSTVCTHLGCLFKWTEANNRFECPCHGSKFSAKGLKLIGGPEMGPAQRNLDRFEIEVTIPDGLVATDSDGHAVKIDGALSIRVNTGKKILGKPVGTPQ